MYDSIIQSPDLPKWTDVVESSTAHCILLFHKVYFPNLNVLVPAELFKLWKLYSQLGLLTYQRDLFDRFKINHNHELLTYRTFIVISILIITIMNIVILLHASI